MDSRQWTGNSDSRRQHNALRPGGSDILPTDKGLADIEHWGSRWLMLEGGRQLVELLDEIQKQHN